MAKGGIVSSITKWLGAATAVVLVGLMNGIASAQDSSAFGSVTGTVGYLPRIALPESAEVVVELIDVTEAGVPPKVLAAPVLVPE
jgi:uncharacterized lipoprotein YbaY